MRKLVRFLGAVCLAFVATLMAACASTEPQTSPRWGVVNINQKLEPVLDELTLLVAGGAISNNVTDDIAQFGPDLQQLVAGYFEAAKACVAIGGALQTETATGRICSGSTLGIIYDQIDAKVLGWAVKTGLATKEGQVIVAGRLVLSAVGRPEPGGVYRDEPDVPLADFDALQARLRTKFEALLAAAAAHARRSVASADAEG